VDTHSPERRRWIRGSLAAVALFAPMPYAWVWAQSEGALRLVRLPKVALVIGNSAYARVPALVNPGNDARGLAETLKASGFAVDLRLDVTQADMAAAIDAYAKTLAERKCVGLFYFAGHGLQLDWHNYLVPIDAAIARVEDIPARAINVSTLIGGIKRAANPMNVLILDACRENPFASQARLEQKGLSQMDAPSGTLLAYATAPGNLAADGAGANGLYTENLLREMRVPEAKIEDVFKRVRLGVRLASRGRQIPWESTSLEEDFYFNPPEQLKKLSREQEDRLFAEERELYEQARASRQAPSLQQYLVRYPSGRFAELAQLQLDGILAAQGEKRVEIAPSQGNPHTAGSARADTRFKVGDRYVYRVFDRLRDRELPDAVQLVTAIREFEVEINEGKMALDLLGNLLQHPNGMRMTSRQDMPAEFVVGKRWTTRYDVVGGPVAAQGTMDLSYRIAARDKVTVPAGTFDCFRFEGLGYNSSPFRAPSEIRYTYWRSPGVRRPVAWDQSTRAAGGALVVDLRYELKEYREG
jgi:hypothetical protein